MSEEHKKYHFSVTLQTQDAAVLHCLRALSQYCEQGKYKQITWGGTKRADWKKHNGVFTVRFTHADYREQYLAEAARLLTGHWSFVAQSDNDPAVPQR